MDQRTRKLVTVHKDFHLRDDIVCICQEKNEEENLPALKIALINQHAESRITLKRAPAPPKD